MQPGGPKAQAIVTGVVTGDPLAGRPVGMSVPLEPVAFGGANATAIPQGVSNWTFFEGAILAVIINTADDQQVVGTAVVVAPGLAVSATHVFVDRLPEVLAGTASLTCFGPTSAGLDIWRVRKINVCETDDIAYMSLELASAISSAWRFRSIALTTRAPKPGERVVVVGFRFPETEHDSDCDFLAGGALYAAAGDVVNVFPRMRHHTLMPYPAIEVACGSLGGMSGGAVLDEQGFLLGVTSRGWETEDGRGPSYASWIVGGLNRQLEIPWPPGMYQHPVHLLEIDERAMRIEGREHVKVLGENTTNYEVWFDRSTL